MLYVVGAGPGDPKLLTLRALEVLREADVVAYGGLIPEEILEFAPKARRVYIGHKREEHDEAVAQLIEEARVRNVVVLKNGDPTVFGRGIEICIEAERRGVPCEIVPGVSSFTAAAALFKIALTDGAELRNVALLSYPHVTPEILKNVKADTLVIFMMGDRLREVAHLLGQHCRPRDLYLCVAVSRPEGWCREVALEDLARYSGLRPALVIAHFCQEKSNNVIGID